MNIAETIGVPHEIIIIENDIYRYPIAKAYNIGAERARFPLVCFSHEDIRFHTPDWGKILIQNFEITGARLIGICGCTVKTIHPSSVYLIGSNLNRQYQLQTLPGEIAFYNENPFNEAFAEVCVLDGSFIASTKQAWEETKFSETYLPAFHGYDIDFSLKNYVRGKVVVSYNFLIEHFSLGSFNKSWVGTQFKLVDIWKEKLPLLAPRMNENDLKAANILALRDLVKVLIETDYSPKVQWLFFLKLLKVSPFHRINLFFLRRLLLRNKLNAALKSLFKPKYGNNVNLKETG